MTMHAAIASIIEEHVFLRDRFFERQGDELLRVCERLVKAYRGGRKLLAFGNGGSAAQAEHIAAELVGRFARERRSLPALALCANTPALTALANDYGYEKVFARQVEAYGERGDVALAISTSGESANVVEGVRAASERGLVTVGLLGRNGGRLKELVDHALVVEGRKTARIQEIHLLIGHILCEAVERSLFESDPTSG
jgi:D-sedoheptulose 7-phosphate isomerase